MTGWQPIETAPRDGTRVWLWLADEGFAVLGIWRPLIKPEPDEAPEMWWLPEMNFWQTDDGLHDITHWQPLPDPP